MKIKKVIIENFKSIKYLDMDFKEDLNIIVGKNETGKSTVLEGINLALTGKFEGSSFANDISPYFFNKESSDIYLQKILDGNWHEPPRILIEVYFYDSVDAGDYKLKGEENSLRDNCIGISFEVKLNEDYRPEYNQYVKDNAGHIKSIPTEYFVVERRDFSASKRNISLYEKRYNPVFIDTSVINLSSGNNYFLKNFIEDTLDSNELKSLSIEYKDLKENFSEKDGIKKINQELTQNSDIVNEEMDINLDISSRNNWHRNLVSYINKIPLSFIGRGKQSKIKINLSLNKNKDSEVVLIDEPENHLTFLKLNSLINNISEKALNKQLILTTHSHLVSNKLGLKHLIVLDSNHKPLYLSRSLSNETQDYFLKLSDYDTLRVILSNRVILVEGPSDNLVLQKVYKQIYGILPVHAENPIDIINVRGLAFKRFLEIAKDTDVLVSVLTDNDGDYKNKIEEKYKNFSGCQNIGIFSDRDEVNCRTLEPSLINVKGNEDILKTLFGKQSLSKEELIEFMTESGNKTDNALKIFNSDVDIKAPIHIVNAIAHVEK